MIVVVTVFTGSKATGEELVLVGAGLSSCGTLIADVSDSDTETKEFLTGLYVQWMQGFMSAINYFNRESGTYLNLEDHDGQWLWLKNYCNEHPLHKVIIGVQILYQLAESQGLSSLPQPVPGEPASER